MFTMWQVYTDVRQLRYGHLMIMTDQDHDGSHIKGLIMNYFHTFYPSLMKLPGFLIEFITPVIKVRHPYLLFAFCQPQPFHSIVQQSPRVPSTCKTSMAQHFGIALENLISNLS